MIDNLLQGIVIENTLPLTWTGELLYSDKDYDYLGKNIITGKMMIEESYPFSDYLAMIPIIGIAAGITRIAFAALHMLNHSLAFVFSLDRRHFAHLAKGLCELFKAAIQSTPIIGNIFAYLWVCKLKGFWWMIKIYNPNSPDSLDIHADYWRSLKQNRPTAYITA